MKNNIYDQEFNIENYIEKKILEIKKLPERSIYKEITQEVFINLYKYHEEKYAGLCNSINSEKEDMVNSIHIGISSYSEYDETDEIMYPIILDDFPKKKFTLQDITKEIEDHDKFQIGKIYFEGDLRTLNKFKNNITHTVGTIITTKGEYKVNIKFEIDKSYINIVGNIHKSFRFNFKKWFPICTAYLYRFFNIIITDIDNDLRGEFIELIIDFGEYQNNVKTDVFPVWNIKSLSEPTSMYPRPIKNEVIYEHKIFSHLLNDTSTYLLDYTNTQILSVARNNMDLIIRTKENEAVQWSLIEIVKFIDNKNKDNTLSNEYIYKDIDMFLDTYRSSIKTRGELIRFINNLPFGEYIEFENFEITNNGNEYFDTYDMEEFEIDEIRLNKSKTLILYFSQKKYHMLLMDFISFYTTCVQRLFIEYRCVGKITTPHIIEEL